MTQTTSGSETYSAHEPDSFLSETMTRPHGQSSRRFPLPKYVQILTDWYLNIGKPLPSVAAIQSAIRSEPTFIRNFRYRFHLSASTSNKSLDRFRGIAHLTKNNEILYERAGDRLRQSIPVWIIASLTTMSVIPVDVSFVSQRSLPFSIWRYWNCSIKEAVPRFWRPIKLKNWIGWRIFPFWNDRNSICNINQCERVRIGAQFTKCYKDILFFNK